MRLGDLDRRSGTIVVRLKGARDEHRVPVSDDFWPVFARYLGQERGLGGPEDPAWVMFRRGHGSPLTYSAFEQSLRHLCRKAGVHVTAHMFRHALAQAVVDVAGLKVAQEMLGHAHISTTADTYSHVDEQAMVAAVEKARDLATYVAEHALSVEGPIREYYLVDRHVTDDESKWRTQIGWPIFRTAQPA